MARIVRAPTYLVAMEGQGPVRIRGRHRDESSAVKGRPGRPMEVSRYRGKPVIHVLGGLFDVELLRGVPGADVEFCVVVVLNKDGFEERVGADDGDRLITYVSE